MPQRKRRASPQARRFAAIRVGDQLQRAHKTYDDKVAVWYYVVSDLWFDPVAGQDDDTAGRMVAIQMIDPPTGNPMSKKDGHTVRGLASQGFQYATLDFMTHAKVVTAAKADGTVVVGIGLGHVIRRRPKVRGSKPL